MQRIIKIAHTAERMTERSAGQRALKVVSRVTVIFSSVLLAATTAVSAESGWPEDNYSGIDTRPVVYLTFDDGPSADTVTEELLKVLARHNATATFFVTGRRVKREQAKIAEIVYAGHAIGNHTYSHAKLTTVSDKEVVSEFTVASEVILAAGGPPQTCFRPPFGSTDSRINNLARQLGMVPVGWSIDTRDWKKSTTGEEITAMLNRTSRKSVVLLHDGPVHRGKMLEAFSAWMEAAAHKYQFQALPECDSRGAPVIYAEAQLPATVPVSSTTVSNTGSDASVVADVTVATATVSEPASPPVAQPPEVQADIPELLAKIRAYRFDLHQEGQRVDLTQVAATLSSEIHGEHIYYSF